MSDYSVKIFFFFIVFFFLVNFPVFGQEIIIYGFVTDSITGEPLIGVSVVDEAQKKGSVTNEYGYFYMKTTAEVYVDVNFSYVGYQSQRVRVKSSSFFKIRLKQGVELSEIIITAKRNVNQPRSQTLSPKMIKTLPSMLGEPDVLKSLIYLPGVTMGNEGTANLHVRGGGPDQNYFLLDGVQLYHVNHMGGFMSAFDANIIKQVDLYKSNFPAHFGGRLSSVVDVHLKDGNEERMEGELMLGTLASKTYIEGPAGDKTTFLASLRRFNLDLFSRLVSNTGYTFYDFNGKITHRLNYKNKLFAMVYLGRDKLFDNSDHSKYAVKWGNHAGAIKWNRVLKPDLFLNVAAAYTVSFNHTDYRVNTDAYQSRSSIQSNINDLSGKFNFSYFREKSNYTFGGEIIHHRFTPYLMSYKGNDMDTIMSGKQYVVENNLYSDIRLNPLKPLFFDLGVRWSMWNMSADFNYLQPRTNVSLHLTEQWTVNGSFSRMVQFMHLLTVSGAGLPSDLWISSTKKLPPETAWQWSFGSAYSFKKAGIDVKLEAFTKKMNDLIHIKEGMIVQPGIDMESIISGKGKGDAKGIEFLLEKKTGKLTGWMAYTLMKNDRIFEDINKGKPFPDVYDRRHDFSIVASYSFTSRLELSATWVCASGRLTTLPAQKYYIVDFSYIYGNLFEWSLNEAHSYGRKNDFRFPPYHRLDIGFKYTKEKKRGKSIWNIGLYNAYNRQNAYYHYIDTKTNKLYQVSIFPIIPSIAYSFEF